MMSDDGKWGEKGKIGREETHACNTSDQSSGNDEKKKLLRGNSTLP